MQRNRIRTVIISLLLIFTLGACTPAQMLDWDRLIGAPDGTTERAVNDINRARAAQASSSYHCAGSSWGWAIGKHFASHDRATACRVMKCESHGHGEDPVTIVNKQGSSASGLFQFLDSTWRSAAKYYPAAGNYSRAKYAPGEIQVATAAAWKNATSWSQWACY